MPPRPQSDRTAISLSLSEARPSRYRRASQRRPEAAEGLAGRLPARPASGGDVIFQSAGTDWSRVSPRGGRDPVGWLIARRAKPTKKQEAPFTAGSVRLFSPKCVIDASSVGCRGGRWPVRLFSLRVKCVIGCRAPQVAKGRQDPRRPQRLQGPPAGGRGPTAFRAGILATQSGHLRSPSLHSHWSRNNAAPKDSAYGIRSWFDLQPAIGIPGGSS